MYQTIRQSAARCVAVALTVFIPLSAHALGLGKLTVRSALNEPLNAEIEISSITDKELKGLQVGLAGASDFEQAGVERLPFLGDVKFSVSKRTDGNYFVQLSTDRQIEEPFLHMLLAVEWPGGRMVREYTALIDPPAQANGKPLGVEVPTTTPVIAAAQPPAQAQAESVTKEEAKTEEPKEESKEAKLASTAEKPEVDAKGEAEQKPSEPKPETMAQSSTPATNDAGTPQQSAGATPMMESPATVAPSSTVEPQTSTRVATTSSSTPSVAKGWSMEGGYNVKWGDTAWRIADQIRANGQTIEQVVLALYRANPQAFFGNNVNNLKSGQVLKIPEGTEIESTAPVKARTEFRAQYDAWQEYKMKLAGASSAIKVVDNEPKQQPIAKAQEPKNDSSADKASEAKKETESQPEPKKDTTDLAKAPSAKGAQQDEMLKIVRSTLQGDKTTPDKKPVEGETQKGAKEQQALADRVTTLEESLASKQAETQEIGDKVSQVRAQLKREARLIQIEQQQLAQAQERAKPSEPVKAESEPQKKAEPAPTTKPETPKAETPKAVEPAPRAEPAPPAPIAAPSVKAPAPVVAKAIPAPTPPTEQPGFLDDLLGNFLSWDSFLPFVIGGVALASLAIGFVYMKRRRKSIAEFEESILQSDAIPGTTGEPNLTTDTSGQVVSSGDTSFLSDFSQGGMGNIHTDEVDPIAEAEVYLAYGRDETAEEILKEAIVKNPAREELKLKLLEIYANRNDVRAFETLAEEMYASMGGRPSKNWPRVEELGKKLNPNNPMFKGGAAAPAAKASASAPAPNFADTSRMVVTPTSSNQTTSLNDVQADMTATAVADSGLDFDMDTSASAQSDGGLDFEMGGSSAKGAAEPALDFAAELGSTSDNDTGLDMDLGTSAGATGVDFDFGEKEDTSIAVAAPETQVAMEAAGGGEAAVGDVTEAPQWDETATKLDLARAYIDMGDSEGARSILDEVISEGNDQQKKQAKELAAQLA